MNCIGNSIDFFFAKRFDIFDKFIMFWNIIKKILRQFFFYKIFCKILSFDFSLLCQLSFDIFFAKGDFTVLRHSSLIWHIHHQLLWEILKVRSHSLDRSSKILGWFLRKFVKKVLSILFKEFVCLFLIPLEIPRVFFFTFLQRFLQIQWFFYWNITSKIALDAASAFF